MRSTTTTVLAAAVILATTACGNGDGGENGDGSEDGVQVCGLEGDEPCLPDYYFVTGCCVPVPI